MAAAKKEEKKLTPEFEWCQDMDRLLMRIKITDVKVDETKLDISRDTFSFSYKNYELKFSFRFPVNPKTIKYRSTRVLELVIEKETSNAYWPHLLPKLEKKKLKNQCKTDWNRFMDEDEAKKRQKGVVDDDNEYGNLANMGMGGGNDEESSSDDSDDKPIDDLEIKPDGDGDNKQEEDNKDDGDDDDDEMPPLQPEEVNVDDKDKGDDAAKKEEVNDDDKPPKEQNEDNKDNDKGDKVEDKVEDKPKDDGGDKAKKEKIEDEETEEVDVD